MYIAEKDDKTLDGKPMRSREEWCKSKLLGSLLESRNDVVRRCTLGDVAFRKFNKVWGSSKIPLEKKLMVYEAQAGGVNPNVQL